ncbi:MAG: glycerate kinase [Bilifractor sp.]|jgi:glycerate kinase
MKIVTAIDSFKGSMTSIEAGNAFAEGFHRVYPDAEIAVRPLADGGEGTVEALTEGMNGNLEHVTVTGPLGKPVDCPYGIIKDSMTAVIEMSGAAGITLIPAKELNPLKATTYGVGEVIADAIRKGCRRFIIGIGGSATNDGGAGMLQALGFSLLDDSGREISRGAEGLRNLAAITEEHVLPELSECTFRIACDVTNPLCGSSGSSAVFGPQKGAGPKNIRDMDSWLARYAAVSKRLHPDADPDYPGTGAAGGLGFAFRTFLPSELQSGIRIVLEETRLESYLADADLVITGEGRLDSQTAMGKVPIGVANLAKTHGKPVIAFAGSVTEDACTCNECGIDAYFPIVRGVTTLEEACETENAKKNMAAAAEQVARLMKLQII